MNEIAIILRKKLSAVSSTQIDYATMKNEANWRHFTTSRHDFCEEKNSTFVHLMSLERGKQNIFCEDLSHDSSECNFFHYP